MSIALGQKVQRRRIILNFLNDVRKTRSHWLKDFSVLLFMVLSWSWRLNNINDANRLTTRKDLQSTVELLPVSCVFLTGVDRILGMKVILQMSTGGSAKISAALHCSWDFSWKTTHTKINVIALKRPDDVLFVAFHSVFSNFHTQLLIENLALLSFYLAFLSFS